jgi:hypothetical protein
VFADGSQMQCNQREKRPGKIAVPGLDCPGERTVVRHEIWQRKAPNTTMGKPAAEL